MTIRHDWPDIRELLPSTPEARLVGRARQGDGVPYPILVQDARFWDLRPLAHTTSELFEIEDLIVHLDRVVTSTSSMPVESLRPELEAGDQAPAVLSPLDLQVIKACGVTFAGSMVERLVEERSGGDPARAAELRAQLAEGLDGDLGSIVPGSTEAAELKRRLSSQGLWSQYLEVGLGEYPEVFTKGPVLSSVGTWAPIGIPHFSSWNNPEPELVLIMNAAGEIVGATLGNDVNLRDIEGRSALLLGMAKDNNRSTAVGPFIRVFDETFTLEDARSLVIDLRVEGPDGFELRGRNEVSSLSRTLEDLVHAARGAHHQYPDGFALFTGTLFAPTQDRDVPGNGFTHRLGDVVSIGSPELGTLINLVDRTEELPPWTYGVRALMTDIARDRGR